MTEKVGYPLLVEQVLNAVSERLAMFAHVVDDGRGSFGDTPIERLLFLSLFLHLRFVEQAHFTTLAGTPEKVPESTWPTTLFIKRQVEIEGVGRVDFLISTTQNG